jgi:DNA-binding response OmpR family regulator
MRNQRIVRDLFDRPDTAFVRRESRAPAPTPVRFHVQPKNSRPAEDSAPSPLGRSNVAELKIHLDGLPILFRFTLDEASTKTLLGAVTSHDNHLLLSNEIGKIVDQIRGSGTRRASSPSVPAVTIVQATPQREALSDPTASHTLLRVGSLELDLLDRTAKRGDRKIDLRPREFWLLRYMMERSDKLLTRAKLLQEVWNYKFVPQTNLVDVHMGRLRRKIDGPNEPAMIRSVRGAGFVLNANPLTKN